MQIGDRKLNPNDALRFWKTTVNYAGTVPFMTSLVTSTDIKVRAVTTVG